MVDALSAREVIDSSSKRGGGSNDDSSSSSSSSNRTHEARVSVAVRWLVGLTLESLVHVHILDFVVRFLVHNSKFGII